MQPRTRWKKADTHRLHKLIGQNVDYLKKLGPVSESTIEELISILKFKELNPDRWNRIPLRGSHYEDIINKIYSNDLSNLPLINNYIMHNVNVLRERLGKPQKK